MTTSPATLGEFLDYLDKDPSAGEEDELLGFLEAATEAAEGWAPKGRLAVGPIVVRSFAERVRAYSGRLYLPAKPVQSVTSATRVVDGQVFASSDLDVNSKRGVVTRKTGALPPGDYDVVFTAGRNPVPESLKRGVLIIAGHMWQTQQGPTTNRFIGSQNVEDTWRPGSGYLIPNRAAHLLTPHCPIGAA